MKESEIIVRKQTAYYKKNRKKDDMLEMKSLDKINF